MADNTLVLGEGISAADVSIGIAGSEFSTINSRYATAPGADSYSLVVSIIGGGSITFTGGIGSKTWSSVSGGLHEIKFSDGTSLSEAQIDAMYIASEEAADLPTIYGGDLGATLAGGLGSQTLIGGAGNDTLVAGSGDEVLVGGLGDNRYQINLGAGNVTILNNRDVGIISSSDTNEMNDTLVLGEGITAADLAVSPAYS